MTSVFEIREFVDDKGKLLRQEVVNVENELQSIMATVEKLQQSPNKSNSTVDLEKLKQSLRQTQDYDEKSLDVSKVSLLLFIFLTLALFHIRMIYNWLKTWQKLMF